MEMGLIRAGDWSLDAMESCHAGNPAAGPSWTTWRLPGGTSSAAICTTRPRRRTFWTRRRWRRSVHTWSRSSRCRRRSTSTMGSGDRDADQERQEQARPGRQLRKDIQAFKKKTDRQVVIWTGSTEIFLSPTAVTRRWRHSRRGWRTTTGDRPSQLYAWAALTGDSVHQRSAQPDGGHSRDQRACRAR